MKYNVLSYALSATIAALVLNAHASADVFTYQGKLIENGAPANGIYDVQATLFDADAGGARFEKVGCDLEIVETIDLDGRRADGTDIDTGLSS